MSPFFVACPDGLVGEWNTPNRAEAELHALRLDEPTHCTCGGPHEVIEDEWVDDDAV